MRQRKIRKIGTSHYVLLHPVDMKDLKLKAGDKVWVAKDKKELK